MKSLKEYGPSNNREHSKGEQVSEFLGIDIKKLDDGGFQFFKLDKSVNYWNPQRWIIVMGCQHPPRFRNLLGQTRMVLRLKKIGPSHMLLL